MRRYALLISLLLVSAQSQATGDHDKKKLELFNKVRTTSPHTALGIQQVDMAFKINCNMDLSANQLTAIKEQPEFSHLLQQIRTDGSLGLKQTIITMNPLMSRLGCD